MSFYRLILLFIGSFSLVRPAHAFLGFGDTKVAVSYPCLGLDGVPIADATLAGQCCDSSGNLNSNASDSCRTSLYGAGINEATSGAASSFAAAQSTLDVAKQLSGNETDYSGSAANANEVKRLASTSGVASSALSAGGTSLSGDGSTGVGTVGNNSSLGAGTGLSNGSGSGGSSGSGSGSSGVGTAGSTASKKANDDANGAKAADAGGAYAAVNGEGSGGAGKDGKVGGLFGSLFGKGGSGVGADGFGDAKFGSGSADANGKGGAGKDGDDTGSTVDPADYFNRIDKSASIFKVVSNRYSKETERKHVLVPSITP